MPLLVFSRRWRRPCRGRGRRRRGPSGAGGADVDGRTRPDTTGAGAVTTFG